MISYIFIVYFFHNFSLDPNKPSTLHVCQMPNPGNGVQ